MNTEEPIFLDLGTHELCRFPGTGEWSLRVKQKDGDVAHLRYLDEFDAKMIEAALNFSSRPEVATKNQIIEECAKAIAKRTAQLMSDPEVCYTEGDTGATVINRLYTDHVEALDEAEAIVLALRSPLAHKEKP